MNFPQKSAVIVYHDSVFGPPHELRDYLLRHNIGFLLCIGHVNRYLINNPVKNSYFEIYRNGKIITKTQLSLSIHSEFLQYFADSFITLLLTLKYCKNRTDYFIGLGNLNVFLGILLHKIGIVNKTVYYVIDYVPQRFSNNTINNFYHQLDGFCAGNASVTWNYSNSMIEARNMRHLKKFPKQTVVPNGIHIRRDIIIPFKKINRNKLVYIGTLAEEQGVQLIIESLKHLIQTYSKLKLVIIGTGPYRLILESLTTKLKLEGHVKFWGRVESPVEADKIMADAVLGFAPYKPENKLVFTTEPGKVKRYLSLGVPVVMTDTGQITDEILKCKCGFKISYNAESLVSAVRKFLQNRSMMEKYRDNAINYAKDYEWDSVFTDAFKSLN